jgi:polyisoprenoid-binding protein YceI
MKTALLFLILASSSIMAGSLVITQAEVQAHTEVFGDSTINPKTRNLTSHLTMGKNIESIKGTIDISMLNLKSDNADRDEHMAESIESAKYTLATYTFKEVKKSAEGYIVNGILNFHGVKKPLSIQAEIDKVKGGIIFKGTSSFLMSNYNVTPPNMLFLTVRDQIDLTIDVTFKKR